MSSDVVSPRDRASSQQAGELGGELAEQEVRRHVQVPGPVGDCLVEGGLDLGRESVGIAPEVCEHRAVVAGRQHDGDPGRLVRLTQQRRGVDPGRREQLPHQVAERVRADRGNEPRRPPQPRQAVGDDRARAADDQVGGVEQLLDLTEPGNHVAAEDQVGIGITHHQDVGHGGQSARHVAEKSTLKQTG